MGRPTVASQELQSSEILILTKGTMACPPKPPPPAANSHIWEQLGYYMLAFQKFSGV